MKKNISEIRTSELVELIAEQEVQDVHFMLSAENEIIKRGLSVDTEVERYKLVKKDKELKPLPTYWKVLLFVFPFGVLQWALSAYYYDHGFIKRSKQCWQFMYAGIIFYFIIIILMTSIG